MSMQQKNFAQVMSLLTLPAGPSEVMIVSNDMEKASIAAADALSQLEHDPDSRAFIISSNLKILTEDKNICQ